MDRRWSKLIEALDRNNWLIINHFRALLPARCVLCAAATRDEVLCRACQTDLPWRSPSRVTGALEIHASFRYAFPIVECIGRAKLAGDCGLARQLGVWMATRPPLQGSAFDLICAVPLHWRRAILRGYNQALEIAKPIATALRRPLWPRALIRRAGMAQRSLGRAQRQGNVVGLFVADAAVTGRRVLVIDDVTTTGATLKEATRALRAAGAAAVTAWVAAAVD